jgi:hypothetical protein
MKVNILGAPSPPPEGVGKQVAIQDYRQPIRKMIQPDSGIRQVILLPQTFAWITVSLAPTNGGTATLYRTISDPDRITADTAIWHPWDHGAITAPAHYDYENPWLAFSVECDQPTLFELVAKNQ